MIENGKTFFCSDKEVQVPKFKKKEKNEFSVLLDSFKFSILYFNSKITGELSVGNFPIKVNTVKMDTTEIEQENIPDNSTDQYTAPQTQQNRYVFSKLIGKNM